VVPTPSAQNDGPTNNQQFQCIFYSNLFSATKGKKKKKKKKKQQEQQKQKIALAVKYLQFGLLSTAR
jgi:Tfp pilus assembly protein PilF